MGPKRRIALVVVAIIVAIVVIPAAAQAFPANGGTETATVDTPAQGLSEASTDTLPAGATQADVTVTPLTDEQFFSKLAITMGSPHYDFGERVEACVLLTGEVVKNPNTFPGYTIPKDSTLQLLFLAACLQTALEVSLQQQTSAREAKAGCVQRTQAMSLQITHSASGYSGQVQPTTKRPKLRLRVRISCRRTATGLVLKIRPRRRGQKLRSTVGPMLAVGVANPAKASIKLKIAFTVK